MSELILVTEEREKGIQKIEQSFHVNDSSDLFYDILHRIILYE